MQEKAIFRFSAFADEITPDFDGQLAALKELGIPLLELRGVDGKSFTQLTDEEVDAVKQKLQNAGIGLSALGSPIGKIDADGDFEAHLRLFDRIMDIGEKLDCRRIRMFSFYRGSLDEAAFEQKVYEWIEKLLVKAEERGFVLCHENEKDIYGDSPAHEHALLSHFGGRLKAVLDLGNFAFC
ncbi:MAG: TIM barrel protein, partial [Clostridia bacterium]|nr:TIM barrel protein [Clostridia bacterium]